MGKKVFQKLNISDIVSSDGVGEEDDEEEPVIKMKKKRKSIPLPPSDYEDNDGGDLPKDGDSVASSEVLTISDNDSVRGRGGRRRRR